MVAAVIWIYSGRRFGDVLDGSGEGEDRAMLALAGGR